MMDPVIDHVFICTAVGAPAADRLRQFGLIEGPPNRHPGQGTACRRFFFQNAMLELLWIENAAEALSKQTRATRLWERWSATGRGASPFGIILRFETAAPGACPFPSWEYRPEQMPDLVLQIASGTALEEPMWCYLAAPLPARQSIEQPAGFRAVTAVGITSPQLPQTSLTRAMANRNVIALETGEEHLLAIQFGGGRQGNQADFRPDLPLVCAW